MLLILKFDGDKGTEEQNAVQPAYAGFLRERGKYPHMRGEELLITRVRDKVLF
jgi:hypothetical protein